MLRDPRRPDLAPRVARAEVSGIAGPPPLTVADTTALLERLGPVVEKIVLVGGQALHVWAETYRDSAPELRDQVFTSKDVDFFGDARVAAEVAQALGGDLHAPSGDDATPNAAIVSFTDGAGHRREIDFLHSLAGVEVPRSWPLRSRRRLPKTS
jgi:hypothetical protein